MNPLAPLECFEQFKNEMSIDDLLQCLKALSVLPRDALLTDVDSSWSLLIRTIHARLESSSQISATTYASAAYNMCLVAQRLGKSPTTLPRSFFDLVVTKTDGKPLRQQHALRLGWAFAFSRIERSHEYWKSILQLCSALPSTPENQLDLCRSVWVISHQPDLWSSAFAETTARAVMNIKSTHPAALVTQIEAYSLHPTTTPSPLLEFWDRRLRFLAKSDPSLGQFAPPQFVRLNHAYLALGVQSEPLMTAVAQRFAKGQSSLKDSLVSRPL